VTNSITGAGGESLRVEPAQSTDRAAVVELWTACGLVVPHNPPDADFGMALNKPNSEILVGKLAGGIVGSVMVGHDGHRGWVYYVAVDPAHQRQGFGERLISESERWLRGKGIRKMQLMVRDSNLGVLDFYRRIGYEAAPVVVMQRWLDDDAE
jgi:ribosomal protein S18 acetylase RimI-like enzyme